MLHTWPCEGDHRFHPAVRDRPHDTVTRRHWLALAADIGLRTRVLEQLCDKMAGAVGRLSEGLDAERLAMPVAWVRNVRRRIARRVRDLKSTAGR